MPSFKFCFFFEVAFFFYDFFMVYITPYMTADHKSVMMSVVGSSGETTTELIPLIFLTPQLAPSKVRELCYPDYANYNVLGFGDVMIPGRVLKLRIPENSKLKKNENVLQISKLKQNSKISSRNL